MSDWRVSGEVLIACNCDWGCPCNFNARPSKGFCQGGWIWMIDQGRVDAVDVGGLGTAVFATWPGAIHEGGGRATGYIDDRADAQQRAALSRIVKGELGGPWGLFIRTYELAAPVAARFDVRLAQHGSRATIGDVVELELQKIRNPVTQAEVHPEFILPEGLVVKRGALATSSVFRVSDEAEYDHSGKYAAFGRFEYS
ncbi:MAG: DUF1326 domain-containing protein [Acidobacteria bacterium]|nr:DUF1326 domain-containing protein [Acidobacteriota bacterium]